MNETAVRIVVAAVWTIYLSGVLVACIWGWRRWLRPDEGNQAVKGRTRAGVIGFCLANGAFALMLAVLASIFIFGHRFGYGANAPVWYRCYMSGFLLSLGAIIVGIFARGKLQGPTMLVGLGMLIAWFFAAFPG